LPLALQLEGLTIVKELLHDGDEAYKAAIEAGRSCEGIF
jgi:hypothetical protein